jgi:hypothetical protein
VAWVRGRGRGRGRGPITCSVGWGLPHPDVTLLAPEESDTRRVFLLVSTGGEAPPPPPPPAPRTAGGGEPSPSETDILSSCTHSSRAVYCVWAGSRQNASAKDQKTAVDGPCLLLLC